MSFPIGQDILSASITRMNMGEGLKNITVQAIGKLLISSDTVPYNVTVSYIKPQKNRKFGDRRFCCIFTVIEYIRVE